jgi:nucleotide-binding universal stress UspA family protein
MTRAFNKILMATDFGPESDVALRSCASLARQLGASIHLLHVVRDPMLTVNTPELYGIDWDGLRDNIVQHSRESLAAAASFHDLSITTEVVVGSPADTIAKRAANIGADIIVMGTHGRGGLGHIFIGSVAERVIRLASCPVMTVRASGATRMRTGEAADAAHVGSEP